MNDLTAERYYPNLMGKIFLQALEEILGREGLIAVLKQSELSQLIPGNLASNLDREIPFTYISKIMSSLETIYGERGGQGLSIRSGRVCFKYGLREFGRQDSLADQNFRLLPLNTKIRQGAKILADIFNKYSDQRVQVGEDEQHFYWQMDDCPLCWGRDADHPICHLAVGTLQEALSWVSGGKFYTVEETSCMARGDPFCSLCIDKLPIE